MKDFYIKEREQYAIFRKRHRIRLIDVAKYCGCATSTLSRWENGLTNISDEILSKYNEYIQQYKAGRVYATNE